MDREPITVDAPERQQFAAIPYPLMEALKLGTVPHNALVVYAVLDTYRNRLTQEAHPGLRTVCEDSGLSINTVRSAVRALEKAGLITIKDPIRYRHPQTYHLWESPRPIPQRTSKSDTRRRVSSGISGRVSSGVSPTDTQPSDPCDPCDPSRTSNPKKDCLVARTRATERASSLGAGFGGRP